MQRVDLKADFALPVERVYAFFAEHENLGPFFGAKITRIKDGHDSRNGVGSARHLKLGPMPKFTETVTQAVENELIEYQITEGSPLKNHKGTMRFTSLPNGGTHLDYEIVFDSLPVLAQIVRLGLSQRISAALKTVDTVA